MGAAGRLEGEAQAAMYVCAASMTRSVTQGLLYCSEDQFGNGRGHYFVDTRRSFVRNTPLYLVERVLKILLQHGPNGGHHTIAFQAMWHARRRGTHHCSQAAMGVTDHTYSFIECGLIAMGTQCFQAQKGQVHLRKNFIVQYPALLRPQQLYIYDAATEQTCHGLHGLMITERVQDALTTGMGQVHIFIGECSPVLAWPEAYPIPRATSGRGGH